MKRVAVTGGSGRFGEWVIKEFKDNGYDVVNIDMHLPKEGLCRTLLADINNIGETYGALKNLKPDAVVHLAAIPVAYRHTDEVTVRTNVMSTYNVFEACATLGIKKVAAASSDSSYGMIFSRKPFRHAYLPIDEDLPQLPQDPYGFSKLVNEETAKMFVRWTDMQIICLRFCFLELPSSYSRFSEFNQSIECEKAAWKVPELWNYVDVRDAARACRLSVETDGLGYCAMNIAGKDTCMDVKTADLVRRHFSDTEIRGDIKGYVSLTSTEKANQLIGWRALHSWREG